MSDVGKAKTLNIKLSRGEIGYLFSTILLAHLLILLAIRVYGLGMSTDGVYYLSAAENVSQGLGVIDFKGFYLVTWPPLLPLFIGAVSALVGLLATSAALLLNSVAVIATHLCFAYLLKAQGYQEKLWFYFGLLGVAISSSFLAIATNLGTDALFVAFSLLFLIYMGKYWETPRISKLVGLALIASLASLLRWTGVIFIVIGSVLILLCQMRNWSLFFRQSLLYAFVSSSGFLFWVVGRNYRLTHTLLGRRELGGIRPIENLQFSLNRITEWLMPNFVTKRIPLILVLLAIAFFLAYLNRNRSWRDLNNQLTNPQTMLISLFFVFYFSFIILTTFTGDHIDSFDDRYQLVMFIPLYIVLADFLDNMLAPHIRKNVYNFVLLLLVPGILWLGYHGFLTYRFVKQSANDGIPYYNIYNARNYHDSMFIDYFSDYDIPDGLPIYSNNAAAVYFFTRRQVNNSLNDPSGSSASLNYLEGQISAWPPEERAVLIWFTPNEKHNYYSPEELKLVSELTLIQDMPDGELYDVEPIPED